MVKAQSRYTKSVLLATKFNTLHLSRKLALETLYNATITNINHTFNDKSVQCDYLAGKIFHFAYSVSIALLYILCGHFLEKSPFVIPEFTCVHFLIFIGVDARCSESHLCLVELKPNQPKECGIPRKYYLDKETAFLWVFCWETCYAGKAKPRPPPQLPSICIYFRSVHSSERRSVIGPRVHVSRRVPWTDPVSGKKTNISPFYDFRRSIDHRCHIIHPSAHTRTSHRRLHLNAHTQSLTQTDTDMKHHTEDHMETHTWTHANACAYKS